MKKVFIFAAFVAAAILALVFMNPKDKAAVPQQTFAAISSSVQNGAQLYDVRTAEEYKAGHFPGALNWPLQDMQAGKLPAVRKDTQIYVYCHSGNRSSQATALLKSKGYTKVTDLGGLVDVQKLGGKLTTETSAAPEIDKQAAATQSANQQQMLLYLIEEEKLAHDIYAAMHGIYGAQVFGNILTSEQSHQAKVLTLLQSRGLADPRTKEAGTFTNLELQGLYDSLLAQGKQSAQEAYKVGVAIEEKDIADITKQLATATDSDIVSTLEALRTGSENHLRAFNRQLSRY